MSRAKVKRLGDIVNFKRGYDLPSYMREEGCYPIISSGGITGSHSEWKVSGEGVITGRYGTLGEVYYINGRYWPHNTTLYATTFNDNYPKYVYYLLKCLGNLKTSDKSAVPGINRNDLHEVVVPYLPPNSQEKIASVLSALDNKIELNNSINDELEQMAKMLYDYWFVQFDFLSEGGKSYKSSGGKMVYNEVLKREIPEGWKVKNLFECTKVQYGYPFSTEYFNDKKNGFPVIRIRDILENSVSNHSTELNIDPKYLIEKGDLLVGMDGNFHINYWSKDDCYLNQRIVMIKENLLPNIIIRYQIEPYIQLREKSVSRTTVGHLSDKDLKRINILIPSDSVISKSKDIFTPFLQTLIENKRQNEELAQLRDWLLPILMNGQVNVSCEYAPKNEKSSVADGSIVAFIKDTHLNIPVNKKGFAKQVLAGKIVSVFKDDLSFTDIKFQKIQFLAEHIIEADLNLNYYYQAAGPYDNKFMHTIYTDFSKQKWFDCQDKKFIPLEKQEKIEGYYQGYFAPVQGLLNKIFEQLYQTSEAEAEIIATLYAVWNNRIIVGRQVEDSELIEDFYQWSDRKLQYTEDQLFAGLRWLRENEMEPKGFGKLIKKAKGNK